MSWQQQIAAERAAGQPLDEVFWQKWVDRLSAHRNRSIPKWAYSVTHAFSTTNWENLAEATEIFIPPWAVKVVFRDYLGMSFSGSFNICRLRYAIGATPDYSSTATVNDGTFPPGFIIPDIQVASGASAVVETEFEIPAAMLGTVQALQPQVDRPTSQVTQALFNVPSDKPRWYFSE